MNFGLGLILSFTDNATNGINQAVGSLNNLTSVAESASSSLNSLSSTTSLSALSVISGQVGDSFTGMGANILSTFAQVIGKVNETGTTLMYAESQLDKLYEGSATSGADMLAKISEYAKTSIFEFENLIPVVTMLKANGIEAFDAITSSSGKSSQMLMDYAADLAAFNPQMKNAYGTGIQAAMGALNEYISEGNARSLKAGASLDIEALLGEEKGATIEERSRQVADLLEQLNMVGMTANLANSPMTKLSNLGDTLFQFLGEVSNSGVYDKFNELITILSDYVNAIPEEEFTNLAHIVSDALATIMNPLKYLLEGVLNIVTAFRELVAEHPNVAKLATVLTAFGGALLLVSGLALKGISALAGLCIVMQTFGGSFSSIAKTVAVGLKSVVLAIAPLVIALGLLYVAWKNDFAGIKTMTTSFVDNTVTAFKTASRAINSSINDFMVTLITLQNKGDFFSNLTIGIMKVMTIFKALSEAWNTYTLSEDMFYKAKALGILPFIEAVLDLKYRFEFFKQGFIDGWNTISEKVRSVLSTLSDAFDGTIFQTLIDQVTTFLQRFSSTDTSIWYDMGQSFADLSAKVLVLTPVFGVLLKTLKMFSPLLAPITKGFGGLFVSMFASFGGIGGLLKKSFTGIFTTLIPLVARGIFILSGLAFEGITKVFGMLLPKAFGGIFTKLTGFLAPILSTVFGNIGGMIVSVLGASVGGIPVALIGAVILGFTALVASISNNKDKVLGAFDKIWSKIPEPIRNVITTVINTLKEAFWGLVDKLGIRTQVESVINFIKSLIPTIVMIGNVVISAVQTIWGWLNSLFKGFILPIVTTVINTVKSMWDNWLKDLIANVIGFVARVVAVVAPFITWVIDNVVPLITTAITTLVNLFTPIVNIIGGVVSAIFGIFNGFIDFFVGIFTGNLDLAWQGVTEIFSSAWEGIKAIFSGVSDFFSTVFGSIVDTFTTIGQVVGDAISGAVKGAINLVLSTAVGMINGFISAINLAIGIINAIPGVSINPLEKLAVPQLAQGGVVTKPTLSVIGEAGDEAVMPLENNTGWIDSLATSISNKIGSVSATPINTTPTPISNTSSASYMTSNTTNNTNTTQGNVDNSVHFESGSIVINCQSASAEEAERMARIIIEKIKRQTELNSMLSYA